MRLNLKQITMLVAFCKTGPNVIRRCLGSCHGGTMSLLRSTPARSEFMTLIHDTDNDNDGVNFGPELFSTIMLYRLEKTPLADHNCRLGEHRQALRDTLTKTYYISKRAGSYWSRVPGSRGQWWSSGFGAQRHALERTKHL